MLPVSEIKRGNISIISSQITACVCCATSFLVEALISAPEGHALCTAAILIFDLLAMIKILFCKLFAEMYWRFYHPWVLCFLLTGTSSSVSVA